MAAAIPRLPFRLLLGGTAALGACAPSFPPIAAGAGTDTAFKAFIAETHPPGSRADALRAELAAQGFAFRDDGPVRYEAVSVADNLPCDSRVRIVWTQDRRGRIRAIGAERHDCS